MSLGPDVCGVLPRWDFGSRNTEDTINITLHELEKKLFFCGKNPNRYVLLI
jgi:hypothetical protein